MNENIYHFFMSAYTPNGFASHFNELADPQRYKKAYLIKGSSGSGKSTLIKKVAGYIKNSAEHIELIHCSLDTSSLDGAIFDEKISIFDATPPHNLEPKLPGAYEQIISLYDCFDNESLASMEREISKIKAAEEIHKSRAQSFIRAAGLLISSNESIAARCINTEKLANFITRLCLRELKEPKTYRGEVRKRFLSTISEEGVFMFTNTAKKLCDRLFVIDDPNGAVSGIILGGILSAAQDMGHTVYACACPMSKSGRIEHLFIPELSLGFMTSNKFHPIDIEHYKTIHTARFMDREAMGKYSARASFQRKAARELLKEAATFIKMQREAHSAIEEYYKSACDVEKRENLTCEVLNKFKF